MKKRKTLTSDELYIINAFKELLLSQALESEDYDTATAVRDSMKVKTVRNEITNIYRESMVK